MQHIGRMMLFGLITTLGISSISAGEAAKFQWKDNPKAGTADLMLGDQPVLRYMYAADDSTPERSHETYKVFHHVFGPESGEVITKGPGGKYTHHRGLYVGWNKTHVGDKTYDFWHMKDVHQRHVEFQQMKGDREQGSMTAVIHWTDPKGDPVIVEERTVTVRPLELANGKSWQIDWQTTLQSEQGEIRLDGDRQHAGFQFRAANAVAEKNSARYLRPQSAPQDPNAFQVNDRTDPDKHVDLGWLAMTYPLGETQYTIEYFEDPAVPKPSRYSERPYGRFGAFFQTTLKPEQPLRMRYRVIVSSGETPSREAIQNRYEQFTASLSE